MDHLDKGKKSIGTGMDIVEFTDIAVGCIPNRRKVSGRRGAAEYGYNNARAMCVCVCLHLQKLLKSPQDKHSWPLKIKQIIYCIKQTWDYMMARWELCY
ncbi:hypothetical protein AVEN_11267-1 [Araneus ventricosus]|uniref:Uncharacterized protein n=1 Tax=Araneus ventricosus TaxID=182803 RepID=A0A4Y2GK35_ARAVE|nr:hypothetical protein AVEN_11267-1 [Araneus ventricosus]